MSSTPIPDSNTGTPLQPTTVINHSITSFTSRTTTNSIEETSTTSIYITDDTIIAEAASTSQPIPTSTGKDSSNSSTNIGSVTTLRSFPNNSTMEVADNSEIIMPLAIKNITNFSTQTTRPIKPSSHIFNFGNYADVSSLMQMNSTTSPLFGFKVPDLNLFFDFRDKLTIIIEEVEKNMDHSFDTSVTENIDLSDPNRNSFGQTSTTALTPSSNIEYDKVTQQSKDVHTITN